MSDLYNVDSWYNNTISYMHMELASIDLENQLTPWVS